MRPSLIRWLRASRVVKQLASRHSSAPDYARLPTITAEYIKWSWLLWHYIATTILTLAGLVRCDWLRAQPEYSPSIKLEDGIRSAKSPYRFTKQDRVGRIPLWLMQIKNHSRCKLASRYSARDTPTHTQNELWAFQFIFCYVSKFLHLFRYYFCVFVFSLCFPTYKQKYFQDFFHLLSVYVLRNRIACKC